MRSGKKRRMISAAAQISAGGVRTAAASPRMPKSKRSIRPGGRSEPAAVYRGLRRRAIWRCSARSSQERQYKRGGDPPQSRRMISQNVLCRLRFIAKRRRSVRQPEMPPSEDSIGRCISLAHPRDTGDRSPDLCRLGRQREHCDVGIAPRCQSLGATRRRQPPKLSCSRGDTSTSGEITRRRRPPGQYSCLDNAK
jgi:hypothetical protein